MFIGLDKEKIMNTNDIVSILALLSITLMFTFLIILLSITAILSFRSTYLFYTAAYESLGRNNVNERVQSIRNEYEVYRRRRFGSGWKEFIPLCQELASKLKSNRDGTFRGYGIVKDRIENLEEVIEVLKDEYNFEDEKINKVVNEIAENTNKEYARKVKEYIIRLQAYCQGQLFEKENEKQHYINKMERKKWFNRLCGIIGIIGSIASIYSIFK